MSFVVRITDQAEADIDRNAIWWADNHSVEQAITWIQTIRQQLKASVHHAGTVFDCAENDLVSYEIRQCSVGLGSRGGYRAIYTIVDDRVVVLTVRRGAEHALRPEELPSSVQ